MISLGVADFLFDWGFLSLQAALLVHHLCESSPLWFFKPARNDARMRTPGSASISRIPPCSAQRGKSNCSGWSIESSAASRITAVRSKEEHQPAIARDHTQLPQPFAEFSLPGEPERYFSGFSGSARTDFRMEHAVAGRFRNRRLTAVEILNPSLPVFDRGSLLSADESRKTVT